MVFQVEIEDDEGNRSVIPITRSEITIGRQDGNVIRLTDRNVSRQHAVLYSHDDTLRLEDLESYTGTHINGHRIEGSGDLGLGDVVRIGDYELRILGEGATSVEPDDSQVTQIDRTSPGTHTVPSALMDHPLHDDDEDQDPTAVINLRAGLGAQLARESFEGLLNGPPARLVVVSAQLAGTEYTVDRSPCRLGRGTECEVRVDHRSISRHHATIEVVEGQFVIKDVGSANGIQVNGETYATTRLQPGDRIDLGHIQLRFFAPGQIPEFAELLSLQRRPSTNLLPTALLVACMLLLAAGAWWAVKGRANNQAQTLAAKTAEQQNWQKTMDGLRDSRRWAEALRHLSKAPFDMPDNERASLKTILGNERKYDEKLQQALSKMATKNWSEALEDLQAIPKNSVYFEEGQRHRGEVIDNFVRLEIDRAGAALESGQLAKANGHVSSAETYAPERREVRQMRQRLEAASEPVETAPPASSNRAKVKPSTTKTKPKKVANLNAAQLLARANQRLIENNPKAALPLLLKAVGKQPKNAQIHRGLGITYASLQETKKARKHYLEYLRLAPNSDEAPQVRRMLGLE